MWTILCLKARNVEIDKVIKCVVLTPTRFAYYSMKQHSPLRCMYATHV